MTCLPYFSKVQYLSSQVESSGSNNQDTNQYHSTIPTIQKRLLTLLKIQCSMLVFKKRSGKLTWHKIRAFGVTANTFNPEASYFAHFTKDLDIFTTHANFFSQYFSRGHFFVEALLVIPEMIHYYTIVVLYMAFKATGLFCTNYNKNVLW